MKSEKKSYEDAASGVEVTQLTDYKGHSHHFYFTNPGWYANGEKLVFSSDRNNRTNLFGVNLKTGGIEQLTDLEPIPLPRELEFLRASKNPVIDEVYFWHDLTLMCVDLATRTTREMHRLEPGWCVSMTNCSADGKYVFFGSWRDLSDRIPTDLLRGYVGFRETWEARPRSRIVRVAVDSGEAEVVFEEDYWIGHVNTSPTQPDILTFCHEGPWDKVDNRIWGMNSATGDVWKIRPTKPGEAVGHEYWMKDGIHVGYHGHTSQGKPMLGRIRYDNTTARESEFPGQTGHIFSLDENLIVGDGSGVIRVWKKEGESYAGPRVLCRHDSAMRIQQTHPHPRISPDGGYVVFTSDRSGYGNVYTAPLAEFESLPPAD
ncbi:MAG: PD40 domain-containing protein [Planctomycetes bacterium]|nr:PD40 domain-containing protein [Planctomycetota bacterium]